MTSMTATPSEAVPTGLWRDFERCYRAVAARDARFDGQFITAVRSTGIYCRPSCAALRPKRQNVHFYPTAAAAQSAGFRACRRCLPDAVPGSPEWNVRADLAARAMRLITDGIVERDGVSGLAQQLGYSARQLGRVLVTELGAGPLALARAHRAHTARLLIERTDLPLSDLAFAAGFASVRQFNATVQEVFARTPSQLRSASTPAAVGVESAASAVTLSLRLPLRPPYDAAGVLGFLAARAVDGVESASTGGYARTLRLPHGAATVSLSVADDYVPCVVRLADVRDLGTAVSRVRQLLDLDADPDAIDRALAAEPALAAAVRASPGVRVPGCVDGAELVLRAMLGQQVTVAAARTAASRLAAACGTESTVAADDGPTLLFPHPADVAEHGAQVLRGPSQRIAAVVAVAEALADGRLQPHVGRDAGDLRQELLAQKGIGPWTADYVTMRVLGATDVLLTGDAALTAGARALGLPETPAALREHLSVVRPWRSYAGMHLWSAANRTHQKGQPS